MRRKRLKFLKNVLFLSIVTILSIGFFINTNALNNQPNQDQDNSLKNSTAYEGDAYIYDDSNYSVYVGYIISNGDVSISFTYTSGMDLCIIIIADYDYDDYMSGGYYYCEDIHYETGTGYTQEIDGWVFGADYYYVIFEDDDSSGATGYLSYSIKTEDSYAYFNLFNSIILPIIIAIIVIAIIVIIIIVVAVSASSKKSSISTPRQNPYTSTSSSSTGMVQTSRPVYSPQSTNKKGYFCPFCGDKTTSDATFCPKCGSKL